MSSRIEDRLAILSAFSRAVADPPRLATVVAAAEDDADALHRVQQVYGLTPEQGRAVLDCQVARMTTAHRARLTTEIRRLRDELSGQWDPPLELAATVHSAGSITLVVDGVAHEVRGASRTDALSRLAQPVHEAVAAPRGRRARVAFSGAGGPVRIHVDPTGDAQVDHDDAG